MRSVLVVDDSPVALWAVSRRLTVEGFTVREAASIAEARAVDPAAIDCAIVDVDLGADGSEGDGPGLAGALRAAHPELPVAFFTAETSPEIVERTRAHGPVFRKPDLEPVVAWACEAARGAGR
jgi:CheY-like chemotaxis protein